MDQRYPLNFDTNGGTTKPLALMLVTLIIIAEVNSQWHYQNHYLTPTHKAKQQTIGKPVSVTASHMQKRQGGEFESMPTSTPTPPFPSSSSPSNTKPPRCGESFNCTSSGIFHRPFEPVMANERCVWTVVVPGASGYQVDVFYLGWDPMNTEIGSQIIINGFKKGSPPVELTPTGKGMVTIPDVSLLVVTFITGSTPGNSTGFILQYTTLTNGTVPNIALQSKHQLIRPDTIYLRHPSTSSNYYQNNELSSFVFEPENNIHVEGSKINIVYMRISLDGPSCGDFMDVYGLNVTHPESGGHLAKWDFMGRICGYLDTQLITSNDMVMMIFQTDQGGTNYGFHLTYTTC